MNESIERNRILNELENDALSEKMKKENEHEYLNSEQGFWYYYNKKDSIAHELPESGDQVFYSYEIRNLAEEVLFSKEEIGTKSYFVDKEELISGLQDGIKLLKEGEVITFLFPSYKAYGYIGSDRIEKNQPLVYEVELIKLNKKKTNN